MNVPNFLSLLRILLVPILVIAFYLPVSWGHLLASLVFCFAALTDWLDGFLARSLQQTSALGAFLDPLADKLIVAVALILIVSEHHLPYLSIPAAIIVGREIAVSGLREWMAELGKRSNVAVSKLGKYKTVLQMAALVVLLAYQPSYGWLVSIPAYILLYTAALLTLWSMLKYLRIAWPDLTRD